MSFPEPPISPNPVASGKQERTWAMLCHLSSLAVFLGIPLGNILGPLIVWLIKKDEFPLVDDQGKEAMNFQISLTIYAIILVVLSLTIVLALVTIPLLIILVIFDLVATIIAMVRSHDGVAYRYPLTIRFL